VKRSHLTRVNVALRCLSQDVFGLACECRSEFTARHIHRLAGHVHALLESHHDGSKAKQTRQQYANAMNRCRRAIELLERVTQ
jgi:hypothetical protein